jgi:hypothetical protein
VPWPQERLVEAGNALAADSSVFGVARLGSGWMLWIQSRLRQSEAIGAS